MGTPENPAVAQRDTNALDGIATLLASPGDSGIEELVEDIREMVEGTGRCLIAPIGLEARSWTDEAGLPAALVNAEGTHVHVTQEQGQLQIVVHDQAGSGLVLEPGELGIRVIYMAVRCPLAASGDDRSGAEVIADE